MQPRSAGSSSVAGERVINMTPPPVYCQNHDWVRADETTIGDPYVARDAAADECADCAATRESAAQGRRKLRETDVVLLQRRLANFPGPYMPALETACQIFLDKGLDPGKWVVGDLGLVEVEGIPLHTFVARPKAEQRVSTLWRSAAKTIEWVRDWRTSRDRGRAESDYWKAHPQEWKRQHEAEAARAAAEAAAREAERAVEKAADAAFEAGLLRLEPFPSVRARYDGVYAAPDAHRSGGVYAALQAQRVNAAKAAERARRRNEMLPGLEVYRVERLREEHERLRAEHRLQHPATRSVWTYQWRKCPFCVARQDGPERGIAATPPSPRLRSEAAERFLAMRDKVEADVYRAGRHAHPDTRPPRPDRAPLAAAGAALLAQEEARTTLCGCWAARARDPFDPGLVSHWRACHPASMALLEDAQFRRWKPPMLRCPQCDFETRVEHVLAVHVNAEHPDFLNRHDWLIPVLFVLGLIALILFEQAVGLDKITRWLGFGPYY